jgi:hypothetical protein
LMEIKEVHPEKQEYPREAIVSGWIIVVGEVHPEKEKVWSERIKSWMAIWNNDFQFKKQ